MVYFTHDYFSMTACKNGNLTAAANVAKKLGVKNLVAVCPVEHAFAWSDNENTWQQNCREAEADALAKNPKMSILGTDLVFGKDATHMVTYMHQSALAGKINKNFLCDEAKFKPVHQGDVTRAVSQALDTGLTGQFAVSGTEEVSVRQLLNLVEKSCGVAPGKTTGRF